MKLGLELTFFPRATPNGVPDAKVTKLTKRFAKLLRPRLTDDDREYAFGIKHDCGAEDDFYFIEVDNDRFPIEERYVEHPDTLTRDLTRVFAMARKLGLTARMSRKRGDTIYDRPNGGGHIHHQIDVFECNRDDFLSRLTRFEINLYADYANRPYVRWLFAQWFDDSNSRVTFPLGFVPEQSKLKEKAIEFPYLTGIRSRFTCIRKGFLPTFEHRYFNAPKDARETLANLRFVLHWVRHVAKLTDEKQDIKVGYTQDWLRSLKQPRFAWREISTFLDSLDLNPADYRDPFEANYLPRMRWGEMV